MTGYRGARSRADDSYRRRDDSRERRRSRSRSRTGGRRHRSPTPDRRTRRRESPPAYRSSRRRESPDRREEDRYASRVSSRRTERESDRVDRVDRSERVDRKEEKSRDRSAVAPRESRDIRPLPHPKAEVQPTVVVAPSHPGSCTVWVGSVPDTATEDDLFDAMTSLGVEVAGMRLVGPRGFGYIRFADEATALKVLEKTAASPLTIAGRRIRVDSCENMPHLNHPYKPALSAKPPGCHTLFVGNLAPDTTDGEISSFFTSQVEGVQVVSVAMRRGGYKGLSFAHVRFDSTESCEKVVREAGGKLRGSRLRLDWAMEKGGGGESGGKVTEELRGRTTKVYIGGLSDAIEEGDIVEAMKEFGIVATCKLHRDKFGVRSFGYVGFATPESAVAAVDNIGNVLIKGIKIRGDFARPERSTVGGQQVGEMMPMMQMAEPVRRARSASPDLPRHTPVSFQVPPEYGPMRSWAQCYGQTVEPVNGTA